MHRTIPEALAAAVDRWADRDAVVDVSTSEEIRLTWAELGARVDEAARAFVATGVERGDRVAIWAPNSHRWIVAALGAIQVGAVVATLNTRFKGAEAAQNIATANASLLVTETRFLDTDYVHLLRTAGEPDCLAEIVCLPSSDPDQRAPDDTTSWAAFLERATEVSSDRVAERTAAIRGDDPCTVIFTSGTTGAPKGALLGHATSIRTFWNWSEVVGLRPDDRYLIVNPFFHTFGLKAGILACILRGATMVPLPVLDVPTVMRVVEQERITVLPGPPAIYQTILNHPDLATAELSSLRLAVTGAAPVPVPMLEAMRHRLGFETVVTGYGLTEAHGVVSMNRHDDPPEIISRTDGRAVPGVEICTVDEHGDPTPHGTPGEIWVRGENLMLGYLGDREATEAAIVDGWLHTGDVGVLDDAGNLRVTGRLKDMVICGGFNVYPAEVEAALLRHPAVAQAAVVGLPDDRLGEVVAAFVVSAHDQDVDPDALIRWSRDTMANYKVPRRVEVVDTLPTNAANKVLKYELRARLAAG